MVAAFSVLSGPPGKPSCSAGMVVEPGGHTGSPVPGDGSQVQGMVLQQRREGTGRSSSLPAQPAEVGGTVGSPVLTAEALLSSPGTQASCQAARRWTRDTVGKGSADQSSKEPVGGLRPARVPPARQQWEVLGCARVPSLPCGQQFACLLLCLNLEILCMVWAFPDLVQVGLLVRAGPPPAHSDSRGEDPQAGLPGHSCGHKAPSLAGGFPRSALLPWVMFPMANET